MFKEKEENAEISARNFSVQKTDNKFSFSDYLKSFTDLCELDRVIAKMLHKYGPQTRDQLKRMTGDPRSTLFDSLSRLGVLGLVDKKSVPRLTPGRPRVVFFII